MPQETESVVMFRGDIARKQQQTVTIHRNSICYGREMDDFLYFSLNQWINDAHQVISITPEWLAWLEQKPRDSYDLAKYIVEETRYGTESVDIRKYEKERKPSTGSIHPRGSTFLGQKLTTLFAPFAVSAGENVIVEDYYKVCEIKNIPSEDGQPKIQWGKEYRGPITQIASLEHWAGVEILPAITGKLYLSDIPGNYNSITEVSFIHLKNEIPVKVKEIGKEIKLQALLQDANPLNEFKIGQRVRGIVTGTNKNTVFVGLHPHLYQAVCSVDRQYIQDISKHFSIGQVVTVLINDINYKTSRIYGRIIHHGEGMGGTA